MDKKELEERRAWATEVMKDVLRAAQKWADQMGEPWLLADVKDSHPEWFEEKER